MGNGFNSGTSFYQFCVMKYLFLFILLWGCAAPANMMLNYTVEHHPATSLSPAPTKIVVFNNHNVKAQRYRENKEQLFTAIIDTLVSQAALRFRSIGIEAVALPGFTPISLSDKNRLDSLAQTYNATHLLAIDSFDAKFIQTEVEVTRTEDSKSREAFYDFECITELYLLDKVKIIDDELMRQRYPHSSRSVASGLLAAGPNIVTQQRVAYESGAANMDKFLDKYFAAKKILTRPIFSQGEFVEAGNAARTQDFQKALQISKQLANTSKSKTAAQAYYNCAVLSELLGNISDARRYLDNSLSIVTLPEAQAMVRSM